MAQGKTRGTSHRTKLFQAASICPLSANICFFILTGQYELSCQPNLTSAAFDLQLLFQSCQSSPEGDRGSSPSWDQESAISRNPSNLSDLMEEQPSSPGSERSSACTANEGMKQSSSSSSLAELVRRRLDESETESASKQQGTLSPPGEPVAGGSIDLTYQRALPL